MGGTDHDNTTPNRKQVAAMDGSAEITDTDDSLNGLTTRPYEYPSGTIQDNVNLALNATIDAAMGVAAEAAELSGKISNGMLGTDETDREEFAELNLQTKPRGTAVP